MATTILKPPIAASPPTVAQGRLILRDLSWEKYQSLGEGFADRPNVRLTYDRGELEIMTLSPEHEGDVARIRTLVTALAAELALPAKCLGSMTIFDRAAGRGLEPDACWYFGDLTRIRGVRRFDPARVPPPDLAIEVMVTHAPADRTDLYAALGVPELWRLRADDLEFLRLSPDGTYEATTTAVRFPMLTADAAMELLRLGRERDDTALMLEVRRRFGG